MFICYQYLSGLFKLVIIHMLKKMFYSTAICLGLVFSISQNCSAQEKTKDEILLEVILTIKKVNEKDGFYYLLI